MWMSMDWTFEDNMVSTFFCATLTGHRGDVKNVMLTDSVKAVLKSVLLPVPLTVMKKSHKDNLQNSTLNPNWIQVMCLQL